MSKIKDNHIYCDCGKDLGELKRDLAYFCSNCSNLIIVRYNPQRTIDFFNKKKEVLNKNGR